MAGFQTECHSGVQGPDLFSGVAFDEILDVFKEKSRRTDL